jgi:hypothetical protein
VQLQLGIELSAEEYVSQRFWERASLASCPLHPEGGCHLSRHTSYPRVTPPGARIARYRCPTARVTFSLLPDCLASRLPSTLAEVEKAVAQVESRDGTMVDLAAQLRPGEPDRDRVQGAVRYLQRRRRGVYAALAILIGLFPDRFSGRQPRLEDFRAALGTTQALVTLRALAEEHLQNLPPPLGFGPRSISRRASARRLQQEAGADPPKQPL